MTLLLAITTMISWIYMNMMCFLIIFYFLTIPLVASAENLVSVAQSYDQAVAGFDIQTEIKEGETFDPALLTLTEDQVANTQIAQSEAPEAASTKENKVAKESSRELVEIETNHLSFETAVLQYSHIESLLQKNNLSSAQKRADELSAWLNQAIEAHFALYKTFKDNDFDPEDYVAEKTLALSFARLRDKNLFLLSEIFIKQEDFKQAVDPLVKIIQSQPGSDIADEAYEQLKTLGFI